MLKSGLLVLRVIASALTAHQPAHSLTEAGSGPRLSAPLLQWARTASVKALKSANAPITQHAEIGFDALAGLKVEAPANAGGGFRFG